MKLTEDKFPILGCVRNNILTDKIKEFVDKQVSDKKEQKEILDSAEIFKNKKLQINYISNSIHQKLLDTSNFIKAKSLLKKSPPTFGLLLLPETVYPNFTNVPEYVEVDSNEYPINAILYSWLSINEHDKITGDYDPEDPWDNEDDRQLLILPIYDDGTTQGTRQFEMVNNDEIYGWEYSDNECRAWYGKIHDYVMSFILFYNYTETETRILHGIDSGKQRRAKLNDEKFLNSSPNDIEIIDSSYFTKIIRTGEFGVNGHFRVQHYGQGNSQSKIIFVDNYKKSGYTRGEKRENNLDQHRPDAIGGTLPSTASLQRDTIWPNVGGSLN